MDRYYLDHHIEGTNAVLEGPEAHHLLHVMRGKPGTRVILFDGSGREFQAVIDRIGRGEVHLAILDCQKVDRELPVRVTLAVSLPKGERQKWLVEKTVEVGVDCLVPLGTLRSVAQPVAQALARLRRGVIEASKQCGRNRLMEIAAPQSWPDLVAATRDVPSRILAHPESRRPSNDGDQATLSSPPAAAAQSPAPSFQLLGTAALPGPVLVAVGPEGGFSPEEVDLAVDAGWCTVDLGPRILRVETAAIVLATLVAQRVATCWPFADR